MTRLCILSPDPAHSEYAAMWPAQRAILDSALAAGGLSADYLPWTGEDALGEYDLVMPLLAWGYHDAPADWLARIGRWAAAGVRLANPADVLGWNADKSYLVDFTLRGAPVVPTLLDPAAPADLADRARARFGDVPLIAKPTMSAGAHGVVLLQPGEPLPDRALGMPMLVQPMMESVRSEGEYSLFYFGGRFSHAILKMPKSGDFRVQAQHGGRDVAVPPPEAALAAAEAVLALVADPLLYARVDLVGGAAGNYLLMELELIEPQLFLERAADGGRAFAEAAAAWAVRSRAAQMA